MEHIHILVPLAQGCEELEAVTIVDLLRRAALKVTTAGLNSLPVKASRNVVLIPDVELADVLSADFAMIVLPGGLPGADNLANDDRIIDLVTRMHKAGKYVAAICAAPSVLAKAGILSGKKATSYPGILDKMALNDVTVTSSAVEVDGNVITSRGPGTAIDFSLKLIELLTDDDTRNKVEKSLKRPSKEHWEYV